MKAKTVNARQMQALRGGLKDPFGRIWRGDRCTLKALRDRGLAEERIAGGNSPLPSGFYITLAGRKRAKFAADEWGNTTFEGPRDPALMKDLPDARRQKDEG